MTKYFLNSGGLKNNPEKALKFFNEIISGLGNKPKILYCFFAEKRENWEEKFELYKKGFLEIIGEKVEPDFQLAFPDKFVKQVKDCDIVLIHGGDDHLIQYWLSKFDIPKIWEGKIIATNSASSDALAKSFWTCDWRQCMDGLGILPIKIMPHYKSNFGKNDPRGPIDWKKAYDELKNFGDLTLPIYALEEGDYVKFEV